MDDLVQHVAAPAFVSALESRSAQSALLRANAARMLEKLYSKVPLTGQAAEFFRDIPKRIQVIILRLFNCLFFCYSSERWCCRKQAM